MTRETVVLTKKEQQRVYVLTRVHHGALRAGKAALLLGLSLRHLRRLLFRLRHHGLAALAHGHRGRPSPRRVPRGVRAKVLTLARTTYAGCNDHHLTELLAEREGLRLSRVTIRRLLRQAGIGSPRTRRPPRHRRRRDRMPQAGLLVQLDGSHHAWLEDRGPWLVLLAAIDDATGRVLGAVFRQQEDAHGYFLLLRQLVRTHGVPVAAYTDRHGIFARDPRAPLSWEEQFNDHREPTQIGRALKALGIHWIPASSPQAKGRIERLFGTFQDRLVQELRLAHACTLADATSVLKTFLPRFNARFARLAAQPASAFRPAPAALDRICCFHYRRIVANDNTVRLDDHLFQLLPGPRGRSYARARVEIHERLDGTFAVYYQDQRLATKLLTAPRASAEPLVLRARDHRTHSPRMAALQPTKHPPTLPQNRFSGRRQGPDTLHSPDRRSPIQKKNKPPADHPWRWGAAASARRKQLQIQGSDIFINPLR
jgi:transposase